MGSRLGEILEGMDVGFAHTVKLCGLLSLWEQVVDERIGKQTEAIKIRNQILYVSTSSPAWAQELTFLKGEIISKFNDQAGKEAIKDIKFKSGGQNG
ncbi:MAG: DUF721 domain-containing protein [Candidatus Margulisbacteria bacterium]|nr:DUF721 domain-containing protein [Candidatus Margulisiibacteriota bacterium]